MMQRLRAAKWLFPFGLLLFGACPALAWERGMICREPSVIDEISREIRAGNYYADVDPALVTERPSLDPNMVRCDVCVLSAPYDTIRFGDRPVSRCVAHGFEVQALVNGFVVRAAR
jgi:hypothetical protein